jgi:hypothetical protein
VGNRRQRAVIVAVVAVRMMEVPIDEVIDMVAMGHRFMPAVGAMPMPRLVPGRTMLRVTTVRVPVGHGDDMLLGAAVLGMLKATVIEVINVAFMTHSKMAACGAVNVRRSLAGAALFRCHGGSFRSHPQSPPEIRQSGSPTRGHLVAALGITLAEAQISTPLHLYPIRASEHLGLCVHFLQCN